MLLDKFNFYYLLSENIALLPQYHAAVQLIHLTTLYNLELITP